jgi:Cu+-exporting ATPase
LPDAGALQRLDLSVTGMSCSACVRAVEGSLNRLEGVQARVNLATETAAVFFDPVAVLPSDLLVAVEQAGYDARLPEDSSRVGSTEPDASNLSRRLNVAVALTAPFTLAGLRSGARTRRGQWAYWAATVPVVAWAGRPFHVRALRSLRAGSTTMDTLVSAGSLLSFGAGSAAVLRGRPDAHRHFDVATGVTVSMLGGRLLEADARREAGAAIRALLDTRPRQARRLDGGGNEELIPVDLLEVGDRFRVRPGEAVATDGVIELGASALDQSLLTGENVPVEVAPGDEVVGGAVNAGGPLLVRAIRVGPETALARIGQLVADAQLQQAPVQRLADRIASVFVPGVITIAAATFAFHRHRGRSPSEALEAALAVLTVACPCALGLATPAALMVGVGRGAEVGIFIRSPEVLESAHAIDIVLLDKTGTVTRGAMELLEVVTDGTDQDGALRLAGAIETGSEHPIGRAVSAAALRRLASLPEATGLEVATGFGVAGTVDGRSVSVGRSDWLAGRGIELPSWSTDAAEDAERRGGIAVFAAWDGGVRAVLILADEVRPTSAEAVARLRALGLEAVMVTGDREGTARAVADAVGIDRVIAGASPEQKAEEVRRLQAQGRFVAFVGDGINDAPALAAADVGLSVGTGTDVAIKASDLTLASADLLAAADAIRLSRRTFATIRTNLRWAAAYNAIALPVAASGRLHTRVASISMTASSLMVVLNSLRLRNFTPGA